MRTQKIDNFYFEIILSHILGYNVNLLSRKKTCEKTFHLVAVGKRVKPNEEFTMHLVTLAVQVTLSVL